MHVNSCALVGSRHNYVRSCVLKTCVIAAEVPKTRPKKQGREKRENVFVSFYVPITPQTPQKLKVNLSENLLPNHSIPFKSFWTFTYKSLISVIVQTPLLCPAFIIEQGKTVTPIIIKITLYWKTAIPKIPIWLLITIPWTQVFITSSNVVAKINHELLVFFIPIWDKALKAHLLLFDVSSIADLAVASIRRGEEALWSLNERTSVWKWIGVVTWTEICVHGG